MAKPGITRLRFQRGAVVVVLSMFLGLAIVAVVSGSVRRYRPDVALGMRPADAYAAAQMATQLQPNSGLIGPEGLLEVLANGAVLRDATAARATRALAIARDDAGKDDEAFALIEYSNALTRRDLPVQIFLVEHYLSRGDLPRTFEHFEAAASTSREATSVLFPLIASAIGDPRVADQLTSLLSREPWWSASMLGSIAEGAGPADSGARLFIRLAELGHPPRRDIAETLVRRLESDGEPSLAARLAKATDVEQAPSDESGPMP